MSEGGRSSTSSWLWRMSIEAEMFSTQFEKSVLLAIGQLETQQWLAQQWFARYASTFAENDIDGAILLLLTEEDLRDELGIQSLGAGKKLASHTMPPVTK
ncbi:unnamed protein product [Calypogeia fissa]